MFINLSFVLALLLLVPTVPLVNSWKLVKEKEGIQVYTSDSEREGLKSIKVSAVFEGTPEKLWALIRDVDKQKQWVYGTKESKVIRKQGSNEVLYYIQTEVPWPVSDRDAIVKMKVVDLKDASGFTLYSESVPKAIPAKEGVVRVPYMAGRWDVRAVGRDKVKIDYFLDLDPGGDIPAWIVNLFVTKGPYETFTNLRSLLKK